MRGTKRGKCRGQIEAAPQPRVSHPHCAAVYQAAKGPTIFQRLHAVLGPCTERHACCTTEERLGRSAELVPATIAFESVRMVNSGFCSLTEQTLLMMTWIA